MVDEPESGALERHLDSQDMQATSRLALVEVPRATRIANPSEQLEREARRLLAACMLIDVTDRILTSAAILTSRQVRTLAAIHLSTALYIEADEVVAYDRRLLVAAKAQGLEVVAPGTAGG